MQKFSKILANQSQQHIIKVIHHDHVGFVPRMEGWLNIYKILNACSKLTEAKKKAHDHLSMQEKTEQNLKSFNDKCSDKTKNTLILNMIKTVYEKAIDCIIVNGDKLKLFSIKSGMK
jgi:hypothetical protein